MGWGTEALTISPFGDQFDCLKVQVASVESHSYLAGIGEQSGYSNHPRAHTVILGWLTTQKSPPPGHAASPVLLRLLGHLDPNVLKPFDLVQVCHGNKICSKLALTWKLTLQLSFPAHCMSNWKLNGISWTNISKVTLNAVNELLTLQSGPVVRDGPPAGLGGKIIRWSMKAWSRKPCRGDLPMHHCS